MTTAFGNLAGDYSSGTLVLVSAAVGMLFFAAAVLSVVRIIKGPSILDRMIATDVLLATIMCGLGGFAAVSGRTDVLPVMLVIAMFGFVGSVSVSRYVSRSDMRTTPRTRRARRRDTGSQVLRASGALPQVKDAATREDEIRHAETGQAGAEVQASGLGELAGRPDAGVRANDPGTAAEREPQEGSAPREGSAAEGNGERA